MAAAPSTFADVQRVALLAAVGLAALVYGPIGGLDGIAVTKTLVVQLAAVVIAGGAIVAAVRTRRLTLPWHPAVALAGAFAVLLVSRAVVATSPGLAFAGPLGRANGVAMYLACVVLFVAAAARYDARTLRWAAVAVVGTGIAVALFAIDEATLRLGPDWAQRPGVAGTMANANFLSSWAGIVLPVTVVLTLDRTRPPWLRIAAVVAVPLLLVSLVVAGSLQGWVVALAVGAVILVTWVSVRWSDAVTRRVGAGVVGLGVLGGVGVVAGAYGVGPLSLLSQQVGVRLRGEYWYAALDMIRDAPLVGVGPARYGDHFRAARGAEGANLVPLTSTSDSAHSVPLHLAAEGGVVLGLLYLAFLVVVGVALVHGLRARQGRERLELGVVGAAWVGYVLQSLISIDVAQLAVVGWVLGGLVVGAATGPMRTFGGAAAGRRRTKDDGPAWEVAAGVVAFAVLGAAAYGAALPWRADAASRTPSASLAPQGQAGSTPVTRAVELAPWEVRYRLQLVEGLIDNDRHDLVEPVLAEAMAVNPRSFELTINAARYARARSDRPTAEERFLRATDLEPHHVELLVEAAEFVVRGAQVDAARDLVARALAGDPDQPDARRLDAALRNPRQAGEARDGDHQHGH